MLWAIDVGNTHTVVGRHDGDSWRAVWRLKSGHQTEDDLASTLWPLCQLSGLPFESRAIVVGSVVPTENVVWQRFAERWLGTVPRFLTTGAEVGLEVAYNPPQAVGADRIANALAAIESFGSPVVVVDFGTATTFDTVDEAGRYIGGAIMPGVEVSVAALASRAAKLPSIGLRAPTEAIGRDTVSSLESGVMFGYAGAVDAVVGRIVQELGGSARVVSTGGLGGVFGGLSRAIERYEPNLTLDGLRLAWPRLDRDSSA